MSNYGLLHYEGHDSGIDGPNVVSHDDSSVTLSIHLSVSDI